MPPPTKTTEMVPPVFRELSLIGGHPALDFLNTVKYRGERDPQDTLASLSDVIEWTRVAGLLSEAESKKLARQRQKTGNSTRIFHEICAFREDARTLFSSTGLKGARFVRSAKRVEAAISSLRPVATINLESGELTSRIVVRTTTDLKARIVAALAEVLSNRTALNIKACAGADCDWLFIDRTKAGRRRWCDTRTCGNIARVRRFRQQRNA